jgi:hypothetical protein
MVRFGGLGLVALMMAMPCIGCRQLVGITDDPPADLTATLCGFSYGTNVCASCVEESCCAESTACAANPACASYQSCVNQCAGDPKCRAGCMASDPGVAPEVSALDACLAASCETPCGLTCASIVERITPPDASAPCAACFEQQACRTAAACASSAECDEYTRCYVACSTPDCRQACAAGRDAGAALFASVEDVYANACSMACAYGQNWNCVGHVVYPATDITSLTQSGAILDYTTGQPVAGVELCASYDCATCGAPGESYGLGLTDAKGLYSLALQLPDISAFGGTGRSFEGCTRTTSPGIVTAWGYMGFPQTQPAWNIGPAYAMTMSTPDEMVTLLTGSASPGGIPRVPSFPCACSTAWVPLLRECSCLAAGTTPTRRSG